MTALLWPGVALVAVVLAFVVAWRWVAKGEAKFATAEGVVALGRAADERLNTCLARINEQAKRLDELDEKVKRLDARTSNDPALARLPHGLRGQR